jgi:hypothetical protein
VIDRNDSEMCSRLADHLRVLVSLTDLYRPDEMRAVGSPGDLELADEPRFAHAGWGDRPVRSAQQDVTMRIAAHVDHLRAYARRVEHKDVTPFALDTIARGALEIAARTAWLLDATDVSDRVGRWAGDKIVSFEKEKEAFDLLRPGEPTPKLDQRVREYQSAALATGVTIMKPPGYRRQVKDLMTRASITINGAAIYAMLSGVAHGEEWGLRMFGSVVGEPGPDGATVEFAQTDRRVAIVATALLSGHEAFVLRFGDVFGRPKGHELWEQEVLATYGDLRPGLPDSPSDVDP